VLTAFAAARVGSGDPAVRRAVAWLTARQNEDGGWGESNDSYDQESPAARHATASTPYQTAWGLLALIAAGEGRSDCARRGAEYLLRAQGAGGLWSDPSYSAPGFPRVFYLKYHGYCAYFPLWALAAYRTATRDGLTH
jgi:squalene-hopene/tetraprenyl-beta-curcumene cyclase